MRAARHRGRHATGPAEVVDDGRTGWLVEPDDEEALAAALVAAVNRPSERAAAARWPTRWRARATPGRPSPASSRAVYEEVRAEAAALAS